jgi:N-acetylglucosaminyl-diphospho-decaprenol L-rhamnosyltransferase
MDMPALDIVIVDYNTGELVFDCLASIAAHRPESARLGRVVVVDNAASIKDLGGEKLEGLPVSLVRNEKNKGFAAGCNQGAAPSRADYLLFLNPDTRLMPDSLDLPIRFLEDPENRRFGIVGISLRGPDGETARTCSHPLRLTHFINKLFALDRLQPRWFSNGIMREWDHSASREVGGVIGAFYLIRSSLFKELGGFDERFFVYFEEADLGLRARRHGSHIYYLSEASAFHKGRGASEKIKPLRLFYYLQSQIRYGQKHFDPLSAAFLKFITLCVEPISRILLACIRCSWVEARDTILGYRLLWQSLARGNGDPCVKEKP